MIKKVLAILIFVFLLTSAAFSRINVSVVVVPPLPLIVELDNNSHQYYQNGYYYNYRGNVWLYSKSKHGPWRHLQKSRYPREVRYRNHDQADHGVPPRGMHDNGHMDRHQ